MNQLITISKEGQPVVTSRQVAEDFEKRPSEVNRTIENLICEVGGVQNCTDLFIQSEYQHEQNKQWYKEYLLTRDGFSLLVMGFTGSKALEWKLKYINAFNQMEKFIKEQNKPACIEDVLISSLQEMKALKQEVVQTREEVQGIREVVAINSTDWRKDTTNLINKIALKLGGYENIRFLREESYKNLEQRAGVQLSTRLTNKRRRMADEGVCKSKRDKLTKVDVIAEDKKVLETYLAIVKEMAIKYGV